MALTAKVAVCVAVWAWAAGMAKSTRAKVTAARRVFLINMTYSPWWCCKRLRDTLYRSLLQDCVTSITKLLVARPFPVAPFLRSQPVKSMRALLVEDDSSNALLSSKVLEADGFAVDLATTAQDGLTCAMVTEYDLIVLDLGLPDGNGLSIVQALRRDGRTAPIMILTGSTDKTTTILALDAGADDYLTKPT